MEHLTASVPYSRGGPRNSNEEQIKKFVKHLLAYIMGYEADLPKSVLQHSGFTESIGKAVQLYMSQLSQTEHSDYNWLIVHSGDAFYANRYITNLSTYLCRSVPHHCFFFFASVCDICLQCKVLEDEDLEDHIKERAVDSITMFMSWEEDQICIKLDASAKELLARGHINLRLETL